MYLALYRTYRPETFREILGQDHIVKILKNQIQSGTVNHAYLFCGTRGTGKTTTARILAKGVNCTSQDERPCGVCENCEAIKDGIFIDVIEIDAASNNGVDNIRELRESVKYPPAAGTKKVYIIDEVHMLSTGAFNALLKTLEEPPEYVMFILATTDPQKLPPTILSRCMRLDFKRVPETLIKEGMENICKEKGIEVAESALRLIAVNADGSVRDGLSILDQCLAPGDLKITREDVLELIGASGEEVFLEIAEMIKNGHTDAALLVLDKALADGKDARQFLRDLLAHYRNLLIVKFIKQPEDILNISCENADRIRTQSEGIPLADINRAIIEISKTTLEAKWSTQPRILLELCIVMLSEREVVSAEAPVRQNIAETPVRQNRAETPVIQKKAAPTPQMQADAPVTKTQESAAKTEKETDSKQSISEQVDNESKPEKETDNSKLWDSIFEGADGLKGSFNMIRSGAEIKSVSESEYIIIVQSDFTKGFIDKNKRTIEELLEKRTGAGRIVKCISEEKKDGGAEGEKPVSQFIAEAESALGLSIEIEE